MKNQSYYTTTIYWNNKIKIKKTDEEKYNLKNRKVLSIPVGVMTIDEDIV